MTDRTLDDVRMMTRAATTTRVVSGSSRIDLLLQGPKDIDPAFAANCLPLMEWAKRINIAFYHQDADTVCKMRNAWAAAMANLHHDSLKGVKVWDSVRGPASACIATLGRIGWDIHISNAWRVWIDRDGNEIDLASFHLYILNKVLHRDIAVMLWSQSTLNHEINDKVGDLSALGLWLEPTRSVVLGKDKQLGAMARSVAIGTQWSQSRVEQAGYADAGDNKCRLCNAEVGTLLHRVDKDGCSKMAQYRKEYIGLLDEAYMDTHQPFLLRERGLMLNSDKPRTSDPDRQLIRDPVHTVNPKDSIAVKESSLWGPNSDPFDGMYLQWVNDNERIFFDDTFVDGSGAIVREDDALSQCGLAVVSVQKPSVDVNVDNSENPDEIITCSCSNSANRSHICSPMCSEISGCNGLCLVKKPEQKLVMAKPLQAAYGPLQGNIQTTPRAELMAIFVAVIFGRSPQRIISDHLNHVVALRNWWLYGDTSFLKPTNPNVDVWRKLHAAIIERGGLCETEGGSHYFTIIWQPSHTRATMSETPEMKHLRRGNAAADYFASLGRGLHPNVSDLVITTQARFKAAKNWITWVAKAAALQYDKDFGMCDHDKRDKAVTKCKGTDQKVRAPAEARILRRMP